MKAMILCAGKGTRLQPLTFATPKPMTPLVDKPVIQYIIEHLRDHGVSDFAINLSYMPEKIHEYLRDGSNHGVNISYSYEGEMVDGCFSGKALGSAGGLKKIQEDSEFFDETFIVMCGDAAVNLDLKRLVAQHKERGAMATIVLKPVNSGEVHKYGVVELTAEGKISQFQEKPDPKDAISTLANTGIYIFEPEILDYIPTDQEYDLGGDLFPILAEKGTDFYGAIDEFDWLDIGNLNDFRGATKLLLENGVDGLSLPGNEIAPGVRVGPNVSIDLGKVYIEGPVYIGGGSTIDNGVKIIGPSVLGQNCVVEEHAVVHKFTCGDHVRIRRNTLISQAISYGGYIINERYQSEQLRPGAPVCDARAPINEVAAQEYAVADLNLLDRMLTDNWFSANFEKKLAS